MKHSQKKQKKKSSYNVNRSEDKQEIQLRDYLFRVVLPVNQHAYHRIRVKSSSLCLVGTTLDIELSLSLMFIQYCLKQKLRQPKHTVPLQSTG